MYPNMIDLMKFKPREVGLSSLLLQKSPLQEAAMLDFEDGQKGFTFYIKCLTFK